MGLLYWLPLTKDLRNQGINNTTVTNNGATYSATDGKLGGCYTSTSSSQNITINFTNLSTVLANGKTYSLSCWVKPTGLPTNGWVIKLGDNSCGLWWAKSTARWVWNENDNGKRCANETISSDYTNWHHLAIVVDKTVSGKITTRQYVDGALAEDYPGSTWDNSSQAQPSGTTITISPYVSYLNDVRIYDHCLTENEVKRLAQGLVLHYPLNRNGWGQENLVQNTHGFNDCYKANESKMTFSGNTVTMSDSGNTALTYTRVECPVSLTTQDLIDAGNITVSMEVMSPNWSAVSEPATSNTDLGAIAVTLVTTPSLPSGGQKAYVFRRFNDTSFWKEIPTLENNKWLKFESKPFIPGTSPTTWSSLSSGVDTYCRFGPTLRSNGTVSFRNIKIELGSIATPWCPNLSDEAASTMGLNGTTEYDISGYGYNGTRIGTLDWTSDTPKYCVSTEFEDYTRKLRAPLVLTNPTAITIAVWIKSSNKNPQGGYHMPLNIDGSHYEFSIKADGKFRQGFYVNGSRIIDTTDSKDVLDGQWHHLCATFDGNIIKRYADGEPVSGGDHSASGTLATSSMLFVGDYGGNEQYGNTQMYESDIRIYATALSADEVKSLYQNCATIGPDGTIYGEIRS